MRSCFHDNIQRLHGTIPLWGLDRSVSLGDLFVDVNILELTSSNRRSELDDLWQDFTKNNSNYRSLDRIGLGRKQQRLSGLAVLERDTNLMIVGKPGSGKTTYLQKILTECNEGKLKENRIPVLIKLREFVDDGRTYCYNLEQFLEHQWRLGNTDIEFILSQGLALILIDGLDEVTGEARKQITKEIKRFARSYPQIQMIVTCRTQSQESKFDRFDYVEVADFNEEQVRAFAEHCFETIYTNTEEGKAKAQEFLSQLFREENKPIRELAITPILLSLTCAVFQQTGKFYSKRSKLYEEGLELLLKTWDTSRNIVRDEIYQDLSVERRIELLSYVAVKKFKQEQYVLFKQEELEEYIGDFLGIEQQESRGVLKAIESQHGLLIERAREIWSFSHLSFQEYLAAKYIVDSKTLKELEHLVQYINKSNWKEIFLLATSMLLNANEILLLMKKEIDSIAISDKEIQDMLFEISQKTDKILDEIPKKILIKSETIRAFLFICVCPSAFDLEMDVTENKTDNVNGNKIITKIYTITQRLKYLLYRLFNLRLLAANNENTIRWQDLIELDIDSLFTLESTTDKKKILDAISKIIELIAPYYVPGKSLAYAELMNCIFIRRSQHPFFYECNDEQLYKNISNDNKRNFLSINKLLINCLDNSIVSHEIRQQIEKSLFLPIAEIEKRKQSNS